MPGRDCVMRRSMRTKARLGAVVVLAVSVVAACGPSKSGGPTLELAGGSAGGRSIEQDIGHVADGSPISIGAMLICLDRPGEVTLMGISLEGTHGRIGVDEFAVRPNPLATGEAGLGATRGGLGSANFIVGRRTVSKQCRGAASAYELGVEVSRASPGIASFDGLAVHYASSSSSGILRIPMSLALCAGSQVSPDCRT